MDIALPTLGERYQQEIARDPDADLSMVAKALNTDAHLYGFGAPGAPSPAEPMSADPYVAQKRQAATAFRSESPVGGGQSAPTEGEPDFRSKDLHNGSVARGAIAHLQALMKNP